MTDKKVESTTPLLGDPREEDRHLYSNTLKKEVRDSREIETGDVRLIHIRNFEGGLLESDSYLIEVITFKPEEMPKAFFDVIIPYPESRNVIINRLTVADVTFGPSGKREGASFNILDSSYGKTNPFEDKRLPKDIYDEEYLVTDAEYQLLAEPVISSTTRRAILVPEKDLDSLRLSREELKKLGGNLAKVRQYLATNLLDSVDETKGLTDPRLQQLDRLMGYLSTQLYFGKNKKLETHGG